jgi:hypothetical protein
MTRMCDVCGVRPAVGTIERIRPGQPPETLHLCQVHLAERRGMGSSFGGLGMFDDLFSRFFSDAAGGEARPGVERSPISPTRGSIRSSALGLSSARSKGSSRTTSRECSFRARCERAMP